MKKIVLLLLSLTVLNMACSDTLESMNNKKSDPHVDEPVIGRAFAGQKSIVVRNIQSEHCEEYCVYYKKVFEGINQDDLLTQDVTLWNMGAHVYRNEEDDIIIKELEPGSLYVIAVIGIDEWGNKSKAVFFKEAERSNIAFLIPYAVSQLAPIESVYLNLLSDGRTVQVGNIYDENATHYEVQYTEAWQENWQTITLEALSGKPVQTKFTGTAWETYNIRVRGINRQSGVNGEWSDVMKISTDADETFEGVNVEWVVTESGENSHLFNIKPVINIDSLPVNSCNVKISGICSYGVKTITDFAENEFYIHTESEAINIVITSYNNEKINTDILSHDFKVSDSESITLWTSFNNYLIEFNIICENRNGDIISRNYLFYFDYVDPS